MQVLDLGLLQNRETDRWLSGQFKVTAASFEPCHAAVLKIRSPGTLDRHLITASVVIHLAAFVVDAK